MTAPAVILAVMMGSSGTVWAQASQPIKTRLGFPIKGVNPYTASITSALDHDRTKWGVDSAGNQLSSSSIRGTIVSWLGERARLDTDGPAYYYSKTVRGYGGDGKAYPKRTFRTHGGGSYLWYENTAGYEHPGYDYGGTSGKTIYAPAAGQLYIVGTDKLLDETWKGYHTFRIDHGDGLSTWFLHVSRFVTPNDAGQPGDWDGLVKSKIGADAYAGKQAIAGEVLVGPVRKDEAVAIVGGFPSFAPHLHMEVRYRNAAGQTTLIDPYGWEGDGPDPLSKNPGQVLWEGYEAPVATSAQINGGTGQVTVNGSGFSNVVKVEVWRRFELDRKDASNQNDGTFVGKCNTTTFVSSTQLLADGCKDLAQNTANYVVRVVRPVSSDKPGPRSRGVKVTIAQGTAAVMVAPAVGSVLGGGSVLQWAAGSSVRQYWLDVCCFADGRRIYPRASQGQRTSLALAPSGLPEDGSSLTVTLETEFVSGGSDSRTYTYRAPQRNVTLKIDGGLSFSRAQGSGTFWFSGSGYRPGRPVRRFYRSGSTVTELTDQIVYAYPSGEISWGFPPTCATPTSSFAVWAVDESGARSNEVTETVLPGNCGDRWAVRVFDSDDIGRARLNGATVVTMGFAQDSGYRDITASLQKGMNHVVFDVENTGGGLAYGFEVQKNGAVVSRWTCGTVGVFGCENNRMFPPGIYYGFSFDIVK